MKILMILLTVFGVIISVIVLPMVYDVCTSAIPKLCVLLDIARLESKVYFLFYVSFGAKILYAVVKLFETCAKIYEM